SKLPTPLSDNARLATTGSRVRFYVTAIVSLTLPAVIGPVDELLGGTPDLVWQRAANASCSL
ncbi:MAG TPA: hypothetical protein VNW93_04105, partial [Mycobacterium sp.]|nr:hypothetical protein [Mycobacterium sp.]